MSVSAPNFDRVARPYRVMEYLTLGRMLERTRFEYLATLQDARKALVLGDGDGRSLALLLETNPRLEATAVDLSGDMLHLLRERCASNAGRFVAVQQDALNFLERDTERYDLIVTHFFLDCLEQPQVDRLAALLHEHTEPGATWIVSEFCIPRGVMRAPAGLLVRTLYLAFRVLTGLRINHLPDHGAALMAAGFTRIECRGRMGGILTAERWRRTDGRSRDVQGGRTISPRTLPGL